jgi:hypothetical protein
VPPSSLLTTFSFCYIIQYLILKLIWDQRQREVLERSWKETNRLSLWYRRLCPFDGCWLLRAIYKGLHGLSFEQVPVHIFTPLKFSFCVTEKWVTVLFPVKRYVRGEKESKDYKQGGFWGL